MAPDARRRRLFTAAEPPLDKLIPLEAEDKLTRPIASLWSRNARPARGHFLKETTRHRVDALRPALSLSTPHT